MQPKWLLWAKQLQAMARTGIEFTFLNISGRL
ncbi:MAG: NUDIX hydrolase N-terminal domain-containing protein [Bacteroidales bacterium]|nr:NUDIX hydrolase N-terminal domain-containing protein [Bacteroidales bacterium]MBK8883809.1 NUDIX hydrolase N-terminal domain-containing protein [Bacteroidales bacterium]